MKRVGMRAAGAAVIVAAATWSPPAAAQNAAAESQLRQLISDIEAYVATQSSGRSSVRTSRPIEVRSEGGAVVATLPDLALANRNGNAVELGTLTVTQRELAPGRLRYEMALPKRIRLVFRGDTQATFTAGDGSLVVVRDVASGLVREVDFRAMDLDVPPMTPSGFATFVGRLELGWTIGDRADGASDAAARVALRDLRLRRTRGGEAASAAELSLGLGVQGVRPAELERVRSAFASGATGDQRFARATEALVAAVAAGGLAGLTTEITVANSRYDDGGAAPLVTIERASLGHTLSGVNEAAAEYQIRYAQQGLALRPDAIPMPQYAGYIPSRVNVAVALQQIPTQVLMRQLLAPGRMPLAAAVVPAIHGMTVRFAPIELDAPAVGAALNGSLTGDTSAPLQATGGGELVVRGLDTVLRELNAQPQSGRGGQSPAAVIAVLAALGQQGTAPDGQPTRSYRIEVTQAGQLMLNGTDMTPLLGAAQGRGPSSPPPAQAPAQPQPQPSK